VQAYVAEGVVHSGPGDGRTGVRRNPALGLLGFLLRDPADLARRHVAGHGAVSDRLDDRDDRLLGALVGVHRWRLQAGVQ
jgi:hypothetical protein